jgi:hypothetical protein
MVEEDGAIMPIWRRIADALAYRDGDTIALRGPTPDAFTIGLVQKGE